MKTRTESDSFGPIEVPAGKYWGAQTQRSLENFRIRAGKDIMPREIIYALAGLKAAAAEANLTLCPDRMTEEKAKAITAAAEEILSGSLDGNFPLVIWQTGSGTQTNMNVNEVIANRGHELAGRRLLHPNDDVNMSQSSNDIFPSAMNIAAARAVGYRLIPELEGLARTFRGLEERYSGTVKCGRTHLQDATPMTFGQEVSGWRASVETGAAVLRDMLPLISALAVGGTAVGTGLNSPEGFGEAVCDILNRRENGGREAGVRLSFRQAPNLFHALSSRGELAAVHGAVKAAAADLLKIANDIRWLASGPRLGLGEITIPANEPGSSIMPGKVNPTQCEALTMAAVRVMGNDAEIGIAASQGNFELNVYAPLIAADFLDSVMLLSDAVRSFNAGCASGIEANTRKMEDSSAESLMLVTALSPHIGYNNAAKAAKTSLEENISIEEAAVRLGFVTRGEFRRLVRPEDMTHPDRRD